MYREGLGTRTHPAHTRITSERTPSSAIEPSVALPRARKSRPYVAMHIHNHTFGDTLFLRVYGAQPPIIVIGQAAVVLQWQVGAYYSPHHSTWDLRRASHVGVTPTPFARFKAASASSLGRRTREYGIFPAFTSLTAT